jgi:hypothetical protein
MEMLISGFDKSGVREAVSLCNDLLAAVMEEAEQFSQEKRGRRGGKGGKGKGGKGDRDGKGHGKSDRGDRNGGKGDRDGGDRKGDGKGDRKGKGGKDKKGKRELEEGEMEEIIPISSDDVDSEFPVRMKLVGENGCNVKHIEDQTKTRVGVRTIRGQLSFVITGFSQDGINEATTMCEDLVEAVLEEAKEASGRGKRDDGPPAKRRRE